VKGSRQDPHTDLLATSRLRVTIRSRNMKFRC
jgi:hypothetical protein